MSAPILARARQALGSPDVPLKVSEVGVTGHPADEILTWAHTHSPDLIVVGSRGLGPLQELLLGSVSEKVVRRAPCPVTVVR